ncbi:MAG: type II toxin-antitoxin system VapC family toxin [Candidatus Schekmanbacteria bacterium]|nr:type II toxin-antitoxin system VapC family toxin [Candidatus Schekmanbacteria bacterium]
MAYLFDTDAISELWRPRPSPPYLEWVATVHREEQFISAVSVGELYKGAFKSPAKDKYLSIIEAHTLPLFTVLPYDTKVARVYGEIRAMMEIEGKVVADPDLQIGATALCFGLALVTGNIKHFQKIPGLMLEPISRTGPTR